MPTEPTAGNGNDGNDDHPANSHSFRAENMHPSQRYELAIQESINIMRERIAEDGLGEDSVHDAALGFLGCVFNRFKAILPAGYEHRRYEYDRDLGDIEYRLRRMSSGGHRQTNSLRLDNILDDLLHEAQLLSQSQIAQCEQCEHCINKYPNMERSDPLTTPNSLDELTLAHVLKELNDSGGFCDTIHGYQVVALLAHIDSMLYVNRPGAVREMVTTIISVLRQSYVSESDERAKFISHAIAEVTESRIRCEKGNDD